MNERTNESLNQSINEQKHTHTFVSIFYYSYFPVRLPDTASILVLNMTQSF